MADDIQYSSGGELVSNKRKYEVDHSPPPPPRRATGFSAPISSQSPDSAQLQPSHNSVLPIVDGVELAKQKAQEIANRIYSNVDQKRPRVENGGGFDSMDGGGNKPVVPSMTSPLQTSSYSFQGSSKKIEIPNGRVGVIIGKAGETIKYLQMQSGAKIQVTRDVDADPNSGTRMVEVMGNPEQIAKAEQLIREVINEADKGGSGLVSRRVNVQQPGVDQFVMQVPNNKVGLVIGKGGESIKNMQARSGARIQVIPLHLPPGDTSTERTVQIDGTPEQIETAKQLVIEVTSENRSRNSGGYQQGGYQARPQSSWGGPPSMQQQPGYGYMQQPGAYPGGPSPQYNMSQPSYSQYPQQASGGGYGSGWDQSSAPQNQAGGQGSYDYYNQQSQPQQQQVSGGQPGGPSDAAASYGYGQAPASGYGQQGYAHDGYGGYHATGPQAGYDQQQQGGYNSAPAYGNGGGGGQVDASQAPPPTTQPPTNSNPNSAGYPPQGSATVAVPAQGGYQAAGGGGYGTQPGYGYGPPQGQKPGYGPPHQSPSGGSQGGGYGQGYPPHSQQPGVGGGYGGPSQTGYGSYGATQAGYGQQQAAVYSSYGGAGSQAPPPAYGGEGTGGATAQPAPPAQAVAKPSPKS